MIRNALIMFVLVAVTACAPIQYKKADLSLYGGLDGYLDKELEPGVYLIEVMKQGGYNYTETHLIPFWEKRANELCPAGYEGQAEMIRAPDARIKEFVCEVRFCQHWGVASGIARCKA
ncbi:hypothetical protein [Stenotrophomonas maltophilia]|uniref:hypothetical protein n=1 Tax=Stenotrophomonas maltophilia TaxID=40324 RepID=UPI0021C1C8A7|nr:hypothetical protein [Stenotrophomonas maltophilia]UXL29814.1 hypothetical protein N0O74_03095 [Stenotrophomonas maltophilia]